MLRNRNHYRRGEIGIPLNQLCLKIEVEPVSLVPIESGTANCVIPVKHPEWGECFLKVYDDSFESSYAYSEDAALGMAKDLGIGVPIHWKTQRTTIDETPYTVLVTSKVPGMSGLDIREVLSDAHAEELLEVLQRLSTAKSAHFGPVSARDTSYIEYASYTEFVSDVFDVSIIKAQDKFGRMVTLAELIDLHQQASPVLSADSGYVLTHKDLNLKNVFFLEGGKPSIIDWEGALYLDGGYDPGVLIASLIYDRLPTSFVQVIESGIRELSGFVRELVDFHVARELFFAAVYGKRQVDSRSLSDTELLGRSVQYFRRVLD